MKPHYTHFKSFTMNQHSQTHAVEIALAPTLLLKEIYAASAWHCITHPQSRRLSPDVEHTIMVKVQEGFDEMCSRIEGYVTFSNFNPNIENGDIQLTVKLSHPFNERLPEELRNIITHLLANYALRHFHSDTDVYFHTAWRKYSAQLLLLFARDANHGCLECA